MNHKHLVDCKVSSRALYYSFTLFTNSNELFSPHLVKHRANYLQVDDESIWVSFTSNKYVNNTPSVKHLQRLLSSKHCSVKSDKSVLLRKQKVNTWSIGINGRVGDTRLTLVYTNPAKPTWENAFTGHSDSEFNRKKHRRNNMDLSFRPGVALRDCFSIRT